MSSLKFEFIYCPCCHAKMHRDDVVFSDKYIKCTNDQCEMVYIPRDPIIRKKVTELISTQYEQESISCAKCKKEYFPNCVLHNEKFSDCPFCSFENPTNEFMRLKAYRHFHGGEGRYGDYVRCQDCDLYYDNYKYTILDSLTDREKKICGNCLPNYGDEMYQEYYDGDGLPFELPTVDTYTKVELTSELHTLSLQYLPELPVATTSIEE